MPTGAARLSAVPVLLVRHAAAGSRERWDAGDAGRPLDDRGRSQASGLVEALAGFDVVRILSSPSLRCVETVQPLAAGHGLTVVPDDDLLEGHSRQAVTLARSLLAPGVSTAGGDGPAVVLCSHGDVIPDVLGVLARDGASLGGDRPCRKGSTWVLWREPAGGVSGRYLPPRA